MPCRRRHARGSKAARRRRLFTTPVRPPVQIRMPPPLRYFIAVYHAYMRALFKGDVDIDDMRFTLLLYADMIFDSSRCRTRTPLSIFFICRAAAATPHYHVFI